jgi:hypothetical protein
MLGNWLSSYKMKKFSVQTEFLEKQAVTLEGEGRIVTCLDKGGIVLCNMLLTPREEHYIMIMAVDDEWVYCFDSYRRVLVRSMGGQVKVLNSIDGRSPNLKIRRQWLEQTETSRFCLGPLSMREALLIRRNP